MGWGKKELKFFKHGDALAIVLPESLRAVSGVKDGDEFEWFEAEPGVFVLASRESLSKQARQHAFNSLLARTGAAERAERLQSKPEAREAWKQREFKPPAASAPGKSFAQQQLYSKGFVVIADEGEAKELSVSIEDEVRKGRVIGVRGFDKKYYVVTREFFEEMNEKIKRALGSKEATVTQISAATKAPLEACLAVLYVLKECGELVEKKKGCFSLVK